MSEIPGINIFVDRQIVEKVDNDLEVRIKTFAILQPHERSKLAQLGWNIISDREFSYTKMQPVEEDDWLDEEDTDTENYN